LLEGESSWCGANVDGKKKSDQEAKKKQSKGLTGKSESLSRSGV
jgi:hypothetical protein